MKLNRRILFIGAVTLVAQMLLAGIVLAQSGPEIREYSAENGYKITITTRGNVIGLEILGGTGVAEGAENREGYVISYVDSAGIVRVVHDAYDSYSAGIRPGERDFVQASFTAPPSQSRIPLNTMISATAVVDTRDGLLRLSNEITWRAGTGAVNVKMTVTNRSNIRSVRVMNVKRVLAPFGLGMDITSLITRDGASAKASGRLGGLDMDPTCPDSIRFSKPQRTPPPPPPPWEIIMCLPQPPQSLQSLQSTQPPHMLLAQSDDLYDLQNIGPGVSLGDFVMGIQTQGIFVFPINSIIAPLGSAGGKNVNYGMR